MAITLGSNFTVNTALPIDDRFTFADLTARNALPNLRRFQGMLVYVNSEQKFYQLRPSPWTGVDADWKVFSGSGSGGGTLKWNSLDLGPLQTYFDSIPGYDFEDEELQEIWTTFIVPAGYETGKQLFLRGVNFYTTGTSGTVLFRATVALLRPGTTNVGTFGVTYTSTNTAITLAAPSLRLRTTGDIDLTDSVGAMSGPTSVAAGDILRIKLSRITDTATTMVRMIQDSSYVVAAE